MEAKKFVFSKFTAEHNKPKADIVFATDSTGSTQPCLDGLKDALGKFVEGLQSAAEVDFVVRLIAFKDLHDPTCKGSPWTLTDFTADIEEFKRKLTTVVADGGGEFRGAESGLDALYLAIHSGWRPDTHKTIIFLTDDDSHPTIHTSTYSRPDNGVERVIQDFQTLRHSLLFLICPESPLYRKIEQGMQDADRKIVANFVSTDDDQHIGLRNVNFGPLLKLIGQQVSLTSVAMTKRGEDQCRGYA